MVINFFVPGADLSLTLVITGWRAIQSSLGLDPLNFSLLPSISSKPSKLSSFHSPLYSITQNLRKSALKKYNLRKALGCKSSASCLCLYVYKLTLRLRSRERIWMTFLNLIKYILSLDYPYEGFGQKEIKAPSLWDAVRILPLGGASVLWGLAWKEWGNPFSPPVALPHRKFSPLSFSRC